MMTEPWWWMPPEWMASASCAGTDPELFFPEDADDGGNPHNVARAHAAIKVCRRCPVRRDCLEYALANGEWHYGIWGGLTPKKRLTIAMRRLKEGSAA
jgi:WhiB family redox-sensing transcriptional regulator